MKENKKLLSTTEAAEILGISRVAVFKKIKSGEIPAKKAGRSFVIERTDLPTQLPEVKMQKVFSNYSPIKLVYLFGSYARGSEGQMSDIDLAVYTEDLDKDDRFDLKLDISSELRDLLNTDKVDVSILNDIEKPELKYRIISEGQLIYEVGDFKERIEPDILSEYFDFRNSLRKYNLTRA